MGHYTYHQTIPSCNLNRAMLLEIEKRLRLGIPRLLDQGLKQLTRGLGLEGYQQLERYHLVIEEKKKNHLFKSAKELGTPYFPAKTKEVKIIYRLAAPKVLSVRIVFPSQGRSFLELKTQSPQIEQLLPTIAEILGDIVARYGNRHRIMHNCCVQAVVLFLVPAAAMLYGLVSGIALFPLYASMGWLCLLSLGVTMSLPHLYPWVTFETKRRFQFKRLPLLVKVALLVVAIGCYLGLVAYNLPHDTYQASTFVASRP